MKGFVINLDIRKDRYQRILKEFESSYLKLERVSAVFHETLDISKIKERISPWNFKYLPLEKIPRVVCSSLSHQQAWKQIVKLNQPAFVFEDDATFICNKSKKIFETINFNIVDFDIIWLNDKITDKPGTVYENDFTIVPYDNLFKTAESYILSPLFAKVLLKNLENDLGAIDAHMIKYIQENKVKCFQLKNPMFCQFDRNDTNIQR